MTRAEFWNLIDAAVAETGRDVGACRRAVVGMLADRPAGDIVDFECTFRQLVADAYRWDLWAAAFVAGGGCSDDGFEYFRRWLVSRGSRAYVAVLADPDALADVAPGADIFFEEFGWVASEAYRLKTGRDLVDDLPPPPPGPPRPMPRKPAGTKWQTNADLASRVPRLYARAVDAGYFPPVTKLEAKETGSDPQLPLFSEH